MAAGGGSDGLVPPRIPDNRGEAFGEEQPHHALRPAAGIRLHHQSVRLGDEVCRSLTRASTSTSCRGLHRHHGAHRRAFRAPAGDRRRRRMGARQLADRRVPGPQVSRAADAVRRSGHQAPDAVPRGLAVAHRHHALVRLLHQGLSRPLAAAGSRVRHAAAARRCSAARSRKWRPAARTACRWCRPRSSPSAQLFHENKWLGGDKPNYADYRALSVFLWTASVATTPPLTDDDPLRDWLDRGFDLFGGLGRHPGMHTLFGLKLRPGDPEPFTKGPAAGRARQPQHRAAIDPRGDRADHAALNAAPARAAAAWDGSRAASSRSAP